MMGNRNWTPAPPGLWHLAMDSNTTTRVSIGQQHRWMQEEAKAVYVCVWSSAPDEAQMQVIRPGDGIQEDWKDYRYMLKKENGQVWMSKPIKNFEHGKHHTNFIPPWDIPSE